MNVSKTPVQTLYQKLPYTLKQQLVPLMQTILDISMAIGPVLGYVHQYYVISSSKSTGTFSIDICGILLFANILRLNFYVYEKYATALVWQSIIMILAQICLVHVCTKYKCKSSVEIVGQVPGYDKGEKLQNFWRWNQFSTYFLFIAFFTFVSFAITLTFKQNDVELYGVFVGLVALLSQSILILPQIIKNYRKKSTRGLSYLLVGLNLFGDIFKFVYFIIKSQAFQFILCGAIQICLDTFVIVQIYFYRGDRLISQKDKNSSTEVSDRYEIEHEIKPQTEKNLDQMEMVDNQKGKLENYVSGKTPHQDTDEEFVYQQWKMEIPPKKQQENNIRKIQLQQDLREPQIQQQNKDLSNLQNYSEKSDKDLSTTQQETNSSTNDSHIRRALSSQKVPSLGSRQFFQASYVIPSKSMENVKVEG